MALSRRSGRAESPIWPGFVDAMSALLLVLMFMLSIFMVVQAVLRDTVQSQGSELSNLTGQIESLADALGLERNRAAALESDVARFSASLSAARAEGEQQAARIAALNLQLESNTADLAASQRAITQFEAQVAALISERDGLRGEREALTASVDELEAARQTLISEQEALNLLLARSRSEIDAQTEAARLAAARAEALEALAAEMREKLVLSESASTRLPELESALSEAEAQRLIEAAAAEALRERLANADTELTAMALALEEQRKRAEETLTLLAAANAAKAAQDSTQSEQERLLALAQETLSKEQAQSAESARRMALLNEQIATLRGQLSELQGLLDAASARDTAANVQLETLGGQLNAALAQVASEQRRRAELELAERLRLEAEAKQLEKFRSEFFGQMREVLAGREGVRIVGDRFVFSSEVLFNPGSAELSPEGQRQIAGVVASLQEVAGNIPDGLDWILRVDGHTDNVPLSGQGMFKDNWDLSSERALSVVRFMQDRLGFAPDRMAATGFGEWQPVAEGDSPEARATNRRIELKLTER